MIKFILQPNLWNLTLRMSKSQLIEEYPFLLTQNKTKKIAARLSIRKWKSSWALRRLQWRNAKNSLKLGDLTKRCCYPKLLRESQHLPKCHFKSSNSSLTIELMAIQRSEKKNNLRKSITHSKHVKCHPIQLAHNLLLANRLPRSLQSPYYSKVYILIYHF